jgi:hypothetical protein
VASATKSYKLDDEYTPDNFLSKFDFFVSDFDTIDGGDPTHGYVNHRNKDDAEALGMLYVEGSGSDDAEIYTGANAQDFLTDAAGNKNTIGRDSVRTESKDVYNKGLVIASFSHLPVQACGAWPALNGTLSSVRETTPANIEL